MPALGQGAGERSRPAPDVENAAGAELVDDRRIDVEVAPIGIQGVVNPGQPRILEQRISHAGTLGADAPRPRLVIRPVRADNQSAVRGQRS